MSFYVPVNAFLEQLGFAVKGEVCGCDVVGVRAWRAASDRHHRAQDDFDAGTRPAGRRIEDRGIQPISLVDEMVRQRS